MTTLPILYNMYNDNLEFYVCYKLYNYKYNVELEVSSQYSNINNTNMFFENVCFSSSRLQSFSFTLSSVFG